MKNEPVERLLLDIGQVMQMVKLSKSSIYKLVGTGRFPPPLRIGRSARWREDTLRAWLEDGCPTIARWNRNAGRKGA